MTTYDNKQNYKNVRQGKVLKVFADGTVYFRTDNQEAGYIQTEYADRAFDLGLRGIELDNYIKEYLCIPTTMQERIKQRLEKKVVCVKRYKYDMLKKLKTSVLKEFMEEDDFKNLLERYHKHLKGTSISEKERQTSKMYVDYIEGMSFEEIAKKYGYKQAGRVEKMISNYSLDLARKGINPSDQKTNVERIKIDSLSNIDVQDYIHKLRNSTKEIVERNVLKSETMQSICNDLEISLGYGYKLKRDALKKITEWKDL